MEAACHNVWSLRGGGEWIGSVVLFARTCALLGGHLIRYIVDRQWLPHLQVQILGMTMSWRTFILKVILFWLLGSIAFNRSSCYPQPHPVQRPQSKMCLTCDYFFFPPHFVFCKNCLSGNNRGSCLLAKSTLEDLLRGKVSFYLLLYSSCCYHDY